ncbi:MAG TPA: hypothetical protein P5026_07940 [Kiritimatiellia bacterium]|nr:hypothetical protein [Kiritimatiellia bacterium]HRU10241.1 hypothetical protein [Thermoanaerobaculia bacterium]
MDRTHTKPGYDEYGWPLYDAAWFWIEVIRPALLVIAAIAVLVILVDLL